MARVGSHGPPGGQRPGWNDAPVPIIQMPIPIPNICKGTHFQVISYGFAILIPRRSFHDTSSSLQKNQTADESEAIEAWQVDLVVGFTWQRLEFNITYTSSGAGANGPDKIEQE